MIRVLQISPFGIPSMPTSGGQIRIAETKKAYERAGCEVSRSCLVTRRRDIENPLDLHLGWIDRTRRQHLGKPSNLGPIRQRWATLRSQALATQLLRRVAEPFDIVHLEHPWAIRLARQLRDHWGPQQTLLVYGSHNIESQLYRSIWERENSWNSAALRLHEQILAAEAECASHADLCWAVSEHDVQFLRNDLGAQKVFLAPNGCRTLPERHHLHGLPTSPYLLFVGGNHRPNIDGFIEWMGSDLSYLPSSTSIVLAGSGGNTLAKMPCYAAALRDGRLVNHGSAPQDILDQLILHSRALVLPISIGGGTNLKTAEALKSKRPIIATQSSMRGFEPWQHTPHIHVCESVSQFRELVKTHLSNAFTEDSDRPRLHTLGWEYSLDQAVSQTLAHSKQIED